MCIIGQKFKIFVGNYMCRMYGLINIAVFMDGLYLSLLSASQSGMKSIRLCQ